jgi:hypothetical protein
VCQDVFMEPGIHPAMKKTVILTIEVIRTRKTIKWEVCVCVCWPREVAGLGRGFRNGDSN